MNCKNCDGQILDTDVFCGNCGGKIIKERLTLNTLLVEAIEKVFGWDNKFMLTLRTLFVKPEKVILSYIDGVRGKYMNPFSIYAFVLAVYVFISTVFQADIDKLLEGMGELIPDSNAAKNMEMGWIFTYQSVLSFINLPIYGLIAYLVFRKPYNFGEHLVISVYTITISTMLSILTLLISLMASSWVFYLFSAYILLILSYTVVYQRIYKFKPLKLLWKIIKFFLIMIGPMILLLLVGVLIALAYKFLIK